MFSLLQLQFDFMVYHFKKHAAENGQQLNLAPQFEFSRRNVERFPFIPHVHNTIRLRINKEINSSKMFRYVLEPCLNAFAEVF